MYTNIEQLVLALTFKRKRYQLGASIAMKYICNPEAIPCSECAY